jgi:phenylacetic acid degradation operon negative regulatory protein
MLFWTCHVLTRPTFRNLTDSFEGWAYRNGFLFELHRLEQQKFIEQQLTGLGDRLCRLTEAGCLRALGGRDPVAQWRRRWDGRWRLVLFDVTESRRGLRDKLRYYLRNHGFGYLQNSVWITPDPVDEERGYLADGPVDVESLILLEASPCAGETDSQIVAGAWDFDAVNRRYDKYDQVLTRRPRGRLDSESAAGTFRRWLREEMSAWQGAVELDPLLPECLLPAVYAGREAWNHRLEAMTEAADQIKSFRLG